MLKIYVACAAVLLSGCALTPEQERERFEAEVQHMRTTYGPGCLAFGEERSHVWIQCVMAAHDRALAERTRRAAAAATFGQALQAQAAAQAAQQAAAQQYRAPITCQRIGSYTTCQ